MRPDSLLRQSCFHSVQIRDDRQGLLFRFAKSLLTSLAFGAGVLSLSLTGCGSSVSPDIAIVHGRVLLNGQPVPAGVITFIPQTGVSGPSGGAQITDGGFEVPLQQGLIQGNYSVEITVIPLRPKGVESPSTVSATDPNAKTDAWSLANPIQRFKDTSQVAVLKPGENNYEIDLKPQNK